MIPRVRTTIYIGSEVVIIDHYLICDLVGTCETVEWVSYSLHRYDRCDSKFPLVLYLHPLFDDKET